MADTIFDVFSSVATHHPDRPFLIAPDGTVMTYAQALARTGQLANAFLANDVRVGDRIALQAEKSETALLLYLAAARIGAVFLPLNTAYTPAEVSYFLGDAKPKLFVCRTDDAPVMQPLCAEIGIPHLLCLDADGQGTLTDIANQQSPDCAGTMMSGDDLAAILYTSGTTGRSKGAMLSHRNLLSNAETLRDYWRFTEHDRLLHALPIFHTHGLFVAPNIIICAQAAMIFLPRFDADDLIRLMPQATALMGVPTFYTRLLSHPQFTRDHAEHMRLFVSGSAPLSAETHKAFQERTGKAILERYGMTETNMNTSNPYDGLRKAGSVGFPLPDVALRIAEPDTGAILPQGEIGMIEVKGPNVFSGYWQMPEKTAEEFRPDGYFMTGDLGFIDADGYVHISGRAKDLIISGGFNIYPAEVEALLDAIPGIAESAVIGVPHPDMGEAVIAVVQASDKTLDEAAVIDAIIGTLARFKQPRRVLFLDALPRNTMGKVQKKQLRETYAMLLTDQAPSVR